jgi:hypothetical protein
MGWCCNCACKKAVSASRKEEEAGEDTHCRWIREAAELADMKICGKPFPA